MWRSVNMSDRFIYLVGGGSVDEPYAKAIGAKGYAKTAFRGPSKWLSRFWRRRREPDHVRKRAAG